MSYSTDRETPPTMAPDLYRPAQFSDITNPNVRGFYEEHGEYWRKNGAPKTWKRDRSRASVPVKFGLYEYGTINENTFYTYFVRLDEIIGGGAGGQE